MKRPSKPLRRSPWRRLCLESLESRLAPAVIDLLGQPNWNFQGPGAILNGQTAGLAGPNPVAGAVSAIVQHPTAANTLFVGTVAGGVWRTDNADAPSPHWVTHTDGLPSLAISSLTLDPASPADPNAAILYAGTGNWSNAGSGGQPAGLYRSVDGGQTWTQLRLALPGVLELDALDLSGRVSEVVATSRGLFAATTFGGLFRNTVRDGTGFGAATGWQFLSAAVGVPPVAGQLPAGVVSDLVVDPSNADRLYASVLVDPTFMSDHANGSGPGFTGTVFRSENGGDTWTAMTTLSGFVREVKLAVSPTAAAGTHFVYAAVIADIVGPPARKQQLAQLQVSRDRGTTWQALTNLPMSPELGGTPLQFGPQGIKNTSLAVDPTDPTIVYLGGNVQPTIDATNSVLLTDFVGRLFRGQVQAGNGATWTQIVGTGASGTAPHADSRAMAFDAANQLLEGDDGGIYRLSNPRVTGDGLPGTPEGAWSSVNGDLAITEVVSFAYDSRFNVFLTGQQDTGSSEQTAEGSSVWQTPQNSTAGPGFPARFLVGDGRNQAADPAALFNGASVSLRYSAGNNFGFVFRRAFSSAGTQVDLDPAGPFLAQQLTFAQPGSATPFSGLNAFDRAFSTGNTPIELQFAINAIPSFVPFPLGGGLTSVNNRMLFGFESVYVSDDGGLTVRDVIPNPAATAMTGRAIVTALAYGGRVGSAPFADLFYAGRNDGTITFGNAGLLTSLAPVKVGSTAIVDIAVDPDNVLTAFALDRSGQLFRTTNGGLSWTPLDTSVLTSLAVQAGALSLVKLPAAGANPARTVLLAGGVDGVFLSVDPAPDATTWVRFGPNLPHARITDLLFDATDDVLAVAVMGRGVFSIPNARAVLADAANNPGVLRIVGDAADDRVRLEVSAIDPGMLNVFVNADPVRGFSLASIRRIDFAGGTGSDTLTLDSANGLIAIPGRIQFNGGVGVADTDRLQLLGTADVSFASAAPNGFTNRVRGDLLEAVEFADVEVVDNFTPPAPLPLPAPTLADIRRGLGNLADDLSQAIENLGLLGRDMPFFAGGIGRGLNGAPANPPARRGDPGAPAPAEAGGAIPGLIRRLVQQGTGAFLLSDIGTRITSLDDLRDRLDALDAVPGNVFLEQENGTIRFDLQILKDVAGEARFAIDGTPRDAAGVAEANSIDLGGIAQFTAAVRFRLVFGVDEAGFFIDASGNPDRELSVGNVRVTSLAGGGRFGFADVLLSNPSLALDAGVSLDIDVREPGADAVFGGSDGRVRAYELRLNPAMYTGTLTADPAATDATFTATFGVAPVADGMAVPAGLPAPATVRLTWADFDDPATFRAVPVGVGATEFYNLIRVSADQIVAGLTDLAGWFTSTTKLELFGQSLTLTGSLGSILETPAAPVVFAAGDIDAVSSVSADVNFKRFAVFLRGTVDLDRLGVAINDTIEYQTTTGTTATGIIETIGDSAITVRFAKALTQTPHATAPNFTVRRAGGVEHQLRAAIGALADAERVMGEVPSLQSLVRTLAEITGVPLTSISVSGSGTGANRVIQFGVLFDPAALTFTAPLALVGVVPGLTLGNAPNFTVVVDPSLSLRFGVRLNPALESSPAARFFFVDDVTPELTLAVTATLNNPTANGNAGFLNVNLDENPAVPNNQGVVFSGTFALNLRDSGTQGFDGRISLAELRPANVLNAFSTTLDLALDIDGLRVRPSTGSGNTLGDLTISVDGSGAGRFTSLAALQGLVSRLTVNGGTNFANFNNLSPATVLDALRALTQRLSDLGRGGPLGAKLPVVNKSLGEVLDLGASYAELLGNPDEAQTRTAQALQDYLNSRLPAGSSVVVKSLPDAIEFAFTFTTTDDDDLPFQLELKNAVGEQLASLINASGGGAVSLSVDATIHLTVGLRTAAGLSPDDRLYLNTTQSDEVMLTVRANSGYNLPGAAPALMFNASLGGLLNIAARDARLLIEGGLALNLRDGGNGDNRLFLREIGAAASGGSFANVATGSFNGLLQAVIPLRFGGNTDPIAPPNPPAAMPSNEAWVSVLGKLSNLGMFDFQTSPTTLAHNTGPAGQPGGVDEPIAANSPLVDATRVKVYAYNVTNLIDSLSQLDLQALIAGLGTLLDKLADALEGRVLGQSLPLVGSVLSDNVAVRFLRDIKGPLVGRLTDLRNANQLFDTTVKQAIFDLLGPGTLLNILGNRVGDPAVTVEDVGLVSTSTNVQFDIRLLSSRVEPVEVASNFGFPNLGITIHPGSMVQFTVNFDMQFGFGVNKTEGFYFNTAPAQELILSAGLTLSNFSATGTLGFLKHHMTDQGTAMTVGFLVDVKDPIGGNSRLTFTELSNVDFGQVFAASASLYGATPGQQMAIKLATLLDFGSAEFPRLRTDFELLWGPFTANPQLGTYDFGPAPRVKFKNVQLDLGSYFNNFVRPIANVIDDILAPVRPVLDILKTRVPGLSELSDVPFAGNLIAQLGLNQFDEGVTDGITLLDLAKRFGYLSDEQALFFEWIIRIDNAVTQLNAAPNGEGVWINIGELDLAAIDTRMTRIGGIEIPTQALEDITNAIVAQLDNSEFGVFARNFIGDFVQDQADLGRPVFVASLLKNKASAFKLLLGQDVDLFNFGPPLFKGSIPAKLPFRLGPIVVALGGDIDYRFNFYFGFDTFGLRQFLASGNPEDVFNGLYIVDQKNFDGSDEPEVHLDGVIGVSGGIDIFVASGYVTGGVRATVKGFLEDPTPDGKVRFNEITFDDPACIFEFQGGLNAGIYAKLTIGVDPVSKSITFPFGPEVPLLAFNHICPTPPPFVLASLDTQTGDLLLHMGPNAFRRNPGQVDEAEDFTVSHVSTEPDGSETVEVNAFGRTQTFSGVRKVIAFAGEFNDTVRFGGPADFITHKGVRSPTDFHGGPGDDYLEGGVNFNLAFGDEGNDTLVGGPGFDNFFGGTGDDLLQGFGGNDDLRGDDGDDQIEGGDGLDRLFGFGGTDSIIGGAGDDWLEGGSGNDFLGGEGGIDMLIGDAGFDIISGGDGNDTIEGGDDVDILIGDAGNDFIYGQGGNDIALGGDGNDTIEGGDGDDQLEGGAGIDVLRGDVDNDTLYGGAGSDLLFGGVGVDRLSGEAGDDFLFGEANDDFLFGNDGNDEISGGDGKDTIDGGTGADLIDGGDGNDRLDGSFGNDTITAGRGSDIVYGNYGRDTIYGGTGVAGGGPPTDINTIYGDVTAAELTAIPADEADLIYGDLGRDLIYGGSGGDTIYGLAGNDEIEGNLGDDLISGGAGGDSVYGDEGNDTISGDDGNDFLHGNDGNDTIFGNDGRDLIFGDLGFDTISGGTHNDTLYGGPGSDILNGDEGDDTLDGGADADAIGGGLGYDVLTQTFDADQVLTDTTVSGSGTDTYAGIELLRLFGGAAANVFTVSGFTRLALLDGAGGNDRIVAVNDVDYYLAAWALRRSGLQTVGLTSIEVATLTGGATANVFDLSQWTGSGSFDGAGGADRLVSFIPANAIVTDTALARTNVPTLTLASLEVAELTGGVANNTIDATVYTGRATLLGGPGNDMLIGTVGDDRLDGGTGTDVLRGFAGNDTLIAGGGTGDLLEGSDGDDVLIGSDDGADTLRGEAGRDRLDGFGGNDTLDGGADEDILDGGAGDDSLSGGTGRDVLLGGADHDTLMGGGDNAIDYLYGDFGTNANEAGSGRDQLFGGGGNDFLFGEGDDDFIDTGTGSDDRADYGAGEGAVPSDFVPPTPTPPPVVGPVRTFDLAPALLPGGVDGGGRWTELAGSGALRGLSGDNALSQEPSIAVDGASRVVAWSDNRNGNWEVYVSRHTAAGWQQLAGSASDGGISRTPGASRQPSVALDAAGNPVVAWLEGSNVVAARFDGTAWVSLGSVSGNAADRPTLVMTADGPVVAWLDTTAGVAKVYVQRFDGVAWVPLGTGSASGFGASATTLEVLDFALATDGTKVAVAWAQGINENHQIVAREYVGGVGSAPAVVFDNGSASRVPTLAYLGTTLFAAWQEPDRLTTEIKAARFVGAAWQLLGTVSNTNGLATQPRLASGGGRLYLVWTDDRRANFTGNTTALYVRRWSGATFVEELPGEASDRGLSHAGSDATNPALAVDAAGKPVVAWADRTDGSSEVYVRANQHAAGNVYYVNDGSHVGDRFTTANGSAGNSGLTASSPKDSVQAILDAYALVPGDVILVDAGIYTGGFTVTAADAGVVILGSPNHPNVIMGLVTVAGDGVTLRDLSLSGGATITGANATLTANVVNGPGVSIAGTGAQLLHNVIAATGTGVSLDGADGASLVGNTVSGTVRGTAVTAVSANVLVRDNRISGPTGIAIAVASSGTIAGNDVSGTATALDLLAPFGGTIADNDFRGAGVGVRYAAAATLSGNRIRDNVTGIVASAPGANGLGFVGTASPNRIVRNTTGVLLTGAMQNQYVGENATGVTGSGTLGGTDLAFANVIEANQTGVSFDGTVQYNRIARNVVGVAAFSGRLVTHNLIYRNTQYGVRVAGAADVRIVGNTFYAATGDLVRVEGGASRTELRDNVLWAETGIALSVADDSQGGFFSDFNVLHAGPTGMLVRYSGDFTDILDWQADVARFDLHSVGRTVLDPFGAQPRFVDLANDDYRSFDLVAGLRFTSPTRDVADPLTDLGLPPALNLLTNPGFENGVTGWAVQPGGGTQTTNPTAFEGTQHYAAFTSGVGIAEQTIDLVAAGYSAAQLDSQDLVVVFGGRVRTFAETPPDRGVVRLTFFNAGGAEISRRTALAVNAADRWELVGGRAPIPVGTRTVGFRFEALRGPADLNNDSHLDAAFLYVRPEGVAPDAGATGRTSDDADRVVPTVALRSPDLYADWERDRPHTIRWETFANADDRLVRIDLYQDGSDGPQFLLNISSGASDTGEYEWIPASNGIAYGTRGLRIQVSLAGSAIVTDRSTEPFAVPENTTMFFVNDRDTAGDTTTTTAGSNRNTGRVASSPKPLPTTVLRLYSLGAGDTLTVDVGTYRLYDSVVLSGTVGVGDDEGFTFAGPAAAAAGATFRFANPLTVAPLLDLNDADLMQISGLTLTGGQYGLWARNGSTDLVADRITAINSRLDGVRIESGSTGATLDRIDARANDRYGVFVNVPFVRLADSSVMFNRATGIQLENVGAARVEATLVESNLGDGISATNATSQLVIGNADLALGRGNRILGNAGHGVRTTGNVLVAGNTVSGHTSANRAGLYLTFGGAARANVVFANADGIYSQSGAPILGNRVYGNSGIGINSDGAEVADNVVFSNAYGFVGRNVNLHHNLLYANSLIAVRLDSSNGLIVNNTIYQPTGDGVVVAELLSNTRLRNNVIWVQAGTGIVVPSTSQIGFASDYNLIHRTGTGRVGRWQGVDRTTLPAWQTASFTDDNSISQDPLFVDAVGGNFHLQSVVGSVKGAASAPVLNGMTGLPVFPAGTVSADALHSPAIDRGDAADSFANEPTPNGNFINLGWDGNTALASLSPATYVLVTRPDGGETWPVGQMFPIRWRGHDFAGTVDIDLLRGETVVASIAAATANDGEFLWTVPVGLTPAADYRVRVSRSDATAPPDTSNATFAIAPRTTIYYVNDGTFAAGDYTTAAGNDANDGLTAATPKASIRAVLQAYNLGVGDTIRVDAGTYNLTTNIVVTADDSGVVIEGYYDPAFPGRKTILDRDNRATGSYVFELQNADDVTLTRLTMADGFAGVSAVNNSDSDRLTVSSSEFYLHERYAIEVGTTNDTATISNNVVRDIGGANSQDRGIYVRGNEALITGNTVMRSNTGIDVAAVNATISNNTASAMFAGINVSGSSGTVTVSGNTLFGNTNGILAFTIGTLVVGNTAYGNTLGISTRFGAEARDNVIFDNTNGLNAENVARGNRVYRNTGYGVNVANVGGLVEGNTIYSNGVGVQGLSNSNRLRDNLVYANTTVGIVLTGGSGGVLENNTVYQIVGDAFRLQGSASNFTSRNNILVTAGGYTMQVTADSQAGFVSDYNLLRPIGSAGLVRWGTRDVTSRTDLAFELGFETHGRTDDPQFLDIDGPDDILGGIGGADDDFRVPAASATVDAGDPASAFSLEPAPHGGRINLGHTGNTALAAVSPAQTVQVLSPNGLEKLTAGTTTTIAWRSFGLTGTPDTVRIELLQDGAVVQTLATAATNAGQYAWAVPNLPGSGYTIRVTSNLPAAAADESDAAFLIAPTGHDFYVNDASTAGDTFTTAVGDNANSGKSADQPLASLFALLSAYDLDAGDTIHVDAGNYRLFRDILITAQDSGVRMEGPATGVARIDRDNANTNGTAFLLENADDVTLDRLTITGAYQGIAAVNFTSDSDRVTVSNSIIDNNLYGGILIGNGNDDWLVVGNTISNHNHGNSGNHGISTGTGLGATIRNNVLFNNGTGISTFAASALIEGNTVYGQFTGISTGSNFTSTGIVVRGNTVYGNTNGIFGGTQTLVEGNTVYDHHQIHFLGYGIRSLGNFGASVARNNVVYNNDTGIILDSGGLAENNVVYGNARTGLSVIHGTVRGNTSYGNQVGIASSSAASVISNNVVYANTSAGVVVTGTNGGLLENNTVYQTVGDAFRLEGAASNFTSRNNVLVTAGGYATQVTADAQVNFRSDYNLLRATGTGKLFRWGTLDILTRDNVYYRLLVEKNGRTGDPLFVDIDGADNIAGNADDDFRVQPGSPTIDAGDPTSPFALEPVPNGGRVNLGHTGNTALATTSTDPLLQVLSPNGLEKLTADKTVTITWRTHNLTGSPDTVRLELVQGGVVVQTIASTAPNTGQYDWTVPNLPGNGYTIRVTSNLPAAVADEPDTAFVIAPAGQHYYVNDASTVGDTLTTAVGDNANSGKSPDQPLADLALVLEAFDLEPGDVIHVDAGTYNLLNNIVLTAQDSGVRIEGPASGTALFDRGTTVDGKYVFEFVGADDVTLDRLSLTNAASAVVAAFNADSDRLTVSRSVVFGTPRTGILISITNDDALIVGNTVRNVTIFNATQPYGITIDRAARAVVRDNEVFGNGAGIYTLGTSLADRIIVSGNLVRDNTERGIYAIDYVLVEGNTVRGHLNNFVAAVELGGGAGSVVARNNTVHGNRGGLFANAIALVEGNRVFNNSAFGIDARLASTIQTNFVYANGVGIFVYDNALVRNNVVYANTNQGMVLTTADGARIVHNTVYQPVGDAVRLQDATRNTDLRNNILRVLNGSPLTVVPGSETGLVNAFNVTVDPLFVDIDGADNVLGYRVADGYDGGRDDNFFLGQNSPAIDRGDPWTPRRTDLYGAMPLDDVGTADQGPNDYFATTPAGGLVAGGTARGWRSNSTFFSLTLPFTFPLYGTNYTQAWVSTEGFVQFGDATGAHDGNNSTDALLARRRLAPLWDNLHTVGAGDDIFVDTSVPNQVTIRWNATVEAGGSDANFSVTLFTDGRSRFDYGTGNVGLTPTVGISFGNGVTGVFTPADGHATLTNAASTEFVLRPGFTDIGAIEFRGSSLDATPPRLLTVTPEQIANGRAGQVRITFSEEPNPVDALALANYQLRDGGPNGVIGDADDTVYQLTPRFTIGDTSVFLDVAGGYDLTQLYRLTISGTTSIHDLSGLRLDGDGNGTGGDNFTFTGLIQSPGITVTPATGLTVTEGGAGSGFTVVLNNRPSDPVTVTLDGGSQLTLGTTTLTFTPANWDVPQSVTVTAIDDNLTEGPHTGSVTFSFASADLRYQGLATTPATVAIVDDDAVPTDITISNATVIEHAAVGTVIGTLSTIDPDIGDVHSYTLLDSAGGRFALVGTELRVADSALLDFETAPSFTVRVRTTDHSGLTYERDLVIAVTNRAEPHVESIVIDDGTAQRSMVKSLTVTFDRLMTVDAGAFAVTLRNGGAVEVNVALTAVDGRTVATLTFSGAGIVGGSLADGNYTLTLDASRLRDAASGLALDGNGDGVPGDNRTLDFFRLYGDVDGSRTVNAFDYSQFRNAFGASLLNGDPAYRAYFDFDSNGVINAFDFSQFRNRFGLTLDP